MGCDLCGEHAAVCVGYYPACDHHHSPPLVNRGDLVGTAIASSRAGRGPLCKGCCRHFRLGVSVSSRAEEGSFAPLKGTARCEVAGDAAVCRRRPSCLLPVYYLFTAVLVALSSCLKWCSSQQLSGRSSARPRDGSTSPSHCCRGSDERERGWL